MRRTPSNLFWTKCSRYSVPLVVLNRHSGAQQQESGTTWKLTAKARFPEYRWHRPLHDNPHFYFHATDTRKLCNIDHAIAE